MRHELSKKLAALYETYQLDAIIEYGGMNNIAPFVGFPAGTVPIGYYSNHVPVGCYLMCAPFRDDKLLSLLYSIEQNLER